MHYTQFSDEGIDRITPEEQDWIESQLDPNQCGFGSIITEELWAPRVDDPLRSSAGFDLKAQLEEMGVLAGEPMIAEMFIYYHVKECPFNAVHKKVVLSQHRSGTISYLCPHHSCQGKKQGFDRKTARDYFAFYGVTIPCVSLLKEDSHD
jgi:hypothetical protein